MTGLHVLFDLDGTLTDSGLGITRCIQHALRRLGRPAPPAAALRHCIGPPLHDSLAGLLGGGQQVQEALGHYRERYVAIGLLENEVYAGVEDMLRALHAAGHRLYIATSKPHVYARRIAAHFGLDRWMAGIHGSELDGTRSGKGELIAHVLRAEGIAAAQALMVGDRRHDVEGAHANGVRAAGVLWGYGSEEELRAAAPAHLLAAPGELVERLAAT